MSEIVTMKTNLIGFKLNCFKRKNLSGFFTCNGRSLTDAEVRRMVNYGISKGYKYDADIPDKELKEILNWKDL